MYLLALDIILCVKFKDRMKTITLELGAMQSGEKNYKYPDNSAIFKFSFLSQLQNAVKNRKNENTYLGN